MPAFNPPLPIDEALPRLRDALRTRTAAVLVAPPGAGKTTRVPLVLADEPWARGKILVLEPRRLAARAAAERMAATLGEQVGETIGLRVRFGSQVSNRNRIEIVTEGIFTRMIVDDPSLDGVSAVFFDEFHERSIDADLGLALARDVQQGLRPDLRLLVMSATLDGARVARLLGGAPVIKTAGRAFPVETRYVGREPRLPLEQQVAEVAARALRSEPGSALVFLPGAAEIRRTESLLHERLNDAAIDIVPLYGALDRDLQDRAIAPAPAGRRKIVLATAIAETSITIEGVRIVIDGGLARVPRYEPGVGLTRLETVRVSRAAADQRRGRAGRIEPGVCVRLWDEPQMAGLEPYATPEILSADLSAFALDLAQWGVADPASLAFLDPPPKPALTEARALLRELGALDPNGRITEQGRKLRQLPLPPRLARMVVDAAAAGEGRLAAEIAAVLTERGLGGDDVDLTHRLASFRRDRSRRAEEARRMVMRWAGTATEGFSPPGYAASPTLVMHPPPCPSPSRGEGTLEPQRRRKRRNTIPQDSSAQLSAGVLLALAYPDRIAKNRGAEAGAFLLANGRGGQIDATSSLAREPYLAVAELSGAAARGRILLAAPIGMAEIEARFADQIEARDEVAFDPATASLRGRRTRRLGAILLSDAPQRVQPSDDTADLLADGIARAGIDSLPWTKSLRQWRDRVLFLRRAEGEEWPDLSDAALAASVREWLAPVLAFKTSLDQLGPDEVAVALEALLPWPLGRRLETEAPTHFEAPSGSRVPIDYAADAEPKLAIRVQELFGLDRHPTVAGVPLSIELLSPAQRPVQITRDLPGFWRGSYAAVRAEMRGRYPKHPWPDDPLAAPATRRAKPRTT